MIMLTRLDGTRFGVNDDQIERVDETPTTVVTLVNGNRYMVQETIDEIVTAIVDFRAAALSRATQVGEEADEVRSAHHARGHRPHLTVHPGAQSENEGEGT